MTLTEPYSPVAWLEHEDETERVARAARLSWLVSLHPEAPNGYALFGGLLSNHLLEEAKYCFVYGQFAASATLGLAFTERLFAAEFCAEGRDDLERARGIDLLSEALALNKVSKEEFALLDRIRRLRNPLLHFRRPLAPDTLEYRAVKSNKHPGEILEEDARLVIQAVVGILSRNAV